jgi:hypothetical protein
MGWKIHVVDSYTSRSSPVLQMSAPTVIFVFISATFAAM